jgi:hypothetical protein
VRVVARFRFPIFMYVENGKGKRALRGEAKAERSFEDQSFALELVQGLTERSGADAAGLSEGLETEGSLSLSESPPHVVDGGVRWRRGWRWR